MNVNIKRNRFNHFERIDISADVKEWSYLSIAVTKLAEEYIKLDMEEENILQALKMVIELNGDLPEIKNQICSTIVRDALIKRGMV